MRRPAGRGIKGVWRGLMGDGPLHRTAKRARSSRRSLRVLLKLLVFGAVTFFVLFPNPVQFVRHLIHVSDMQAMIEPDAPQLAGWEAEFRRRVAEKQQAWQRAEATSTQPYGHREVQQELERFVYEKVKYDWDWNVWGSADYMPTVEEMFDQAASSPDGQMREDCDGRAIIAASLLRRLGYASTVVTDLRHVWVTTGEGEWMGPGRTKTIVSSDEGNRTAFFATLGNMPVALSYGLAVFPLWRELIILGTAFLLTLGGRMAWGTTAFGGMLLLQGLLFMRLGYLAPQGVSGSGAAWPVWVGVMHMLGGFGVLLLTSFYARRTSGFSPNG
jgi:hypothetical protein